MPIGRRAGMSNALVGQVLHELLERQLLQEQFEENDLLLYALLHENANPAPEEPWTRFDLIG